MFNRNYFKILEPQSLQQASESLKMIMSQLNSRMLISKEVEKLKFEQMIMKEMKKISHRNDWFLRIGR
jgi:DNA anti-recombination protein RmuC